MALLVPASSFSKVKTLRSQDVHVELPKNFGRRKTRGILRFSPPCDTCNSPSISPFPQMPVNVFPVRNEPFGERGETRMWLSW